MTHPAPPPLLRRALAEGVGSLVLVAAIVGSGIAATQLSPADPGIQLLQNSIATVLALGVLIVVLAPVSGAHFNPVVTLLDPGMWRRTASHRPPISVAVYVAAQIAGAIAGAVLANAMFALPTEWARTQRATAPHLLAEVVATAGLILVIHGLARSGRSQFAAPAVAAYIGAAYWFTSSTSFANPAVTIGRMFSDSFAGISPASVLPFIAAQVVGGILGFAVAAAIFAPPRIPTPTPRRVNDFAPSERLNPRFNPFARG